jgi:hypothetical protein
MAYRMEEYLVCVVAALGFGTLLLAGSLLVMLAREGFAHAFQALRRAANATLQVSSSFAGRHLQSSPSPVLVSGRMVARERNHPGGERGVRQPTDRLRVFEPRAGALG